MGAHQNKTEEWSLTGKRVLITGGNSGIGLETARALASRGARVTITARDHRRGEAVLSDFHRAGLELSLLTLDLASLSSVRACAEIERRIPDPLDVLINNAGVALSSRSLTEDGLERTFQVNHFGHFLLTHLLLDKLRQAGNARVIALSSRAYLWAGRGIRFDDLTRERKYRGLRVYGESKLANIYHMSELARREASNGIEAFSLHPGVVATRFAGDGDMTGPAAWALRAFLALALRPHQGAKTSIYLSSASGLADKSGQFFHRCKPYPLTAIGQDSSAAERLWTISEKLTGIASP